MTFYANETFKILISTCMVATPFESLPFQRELDLEAIVKWYIAAMNSLLYQYSAQWLQRGVLGFPNRFSSDHTQTSELQNRFCRLK